VASIAQDDPSPLPGKHRESRCMQRPQCARMHCDSQCMRANCGLRPQCVVNLDRNLKPKLAIMRQCTLVTDRWTDGQTDGHWHRSMSTRCIYYIILEKKWVFSLDLNDIIYSVTACQELSLAASCRQPVLCSGKHASQMSSWWKVGSVSRWPIYITGCGCILTSAMKLGWRRHAVDLEREQSHFVVKYISRYNL